MSPPAVKVSIVSDAVASKTKPRMFLNNLTSQAACL